MWLLDHVIVYMTPETHQISDKPADIEVRLEPSEPTEWPNVSRVGAYHLVVDAETDDDWRSTVRILRKAWYRGLNWKIAVVFATRAEAKALQDLILHNPSVKGWYRHPTGAYQPL